MNDFKGRHFGGEIVLWAVRGCCRYVVSYRDLEAMMTERGVALDHSTIYLYGRPSRCKRWWDERRGSVANIYPASPVWGAQMGNPHAPASTAGRPLRPR